MVLDALTEGRLKVGFILHEPTVDYRFLCVDGKKRRSDDLNFDLEDGYGFLIVFKDNTINLYPALHDIPNPHSAAHSSETLQRDQRADNGVRH